MADWINNPNLQQTYSAFVSSIRARDEDAAKMFNGVGTNPPDETIRWNGGAAVFQVYSSAATSWSAVSPGLQQLVVASASKSRTLIAVDTYTTSAVWTKPVGCTAIEVWCIGGGGGGGCGYVKDSGSKGRAAAAGGGGSGGFSYAFKESGINAIASVSIGKGGLYGAVASSGDAGTVSWFQSAGFISAGGGSGGGLATSSTAAPIAIGGGGSGGSAPAGDIKVNGNNGCYGAYAEYYTTSSYAIQAGAGGRAALFGQDGGFKGLEYAASLTITIARTGQNGYGYGSGGEGGVAYVAGGTSANRGGSGTDGIVIVKSYT